MQTNMDEAVDASVSEPASESPPSEARVVPGLPDPEAPDEDPGEETFDPEELDALVRGEPYRAPQIYPGSRCQGTIVAVGDEGVIVSFGAKVEGRVALEEFRDPAGEVMAVPGQEV